MQTTKRSLSGFVGLVACLITVVTFAHDPDPNVSVKLAYDSKAAASSSTSSSSSSAASSSSSTGIAKSDSGAAGPSAECANGTARRPPSCTEAAEGKATEIFFNCLKLAESSTKIESIREYCNKLLTDVNNYRAFAPFKSSEYLEQNSSSFQNFGLPLLFLFDVLIAYFVVRVCMLVDPWGSGGSMNSQKFLCEKSKTVVSEKGGSPTTTTTEGSSSFSRVIGFFGGLISLFLLVLIVNVFILHLIFLGGFPDASLFFAPGAGLFVTVLPYIFNLLQGSKP